MCWWSDLLVTYRLTSRLTAPIPQGFNLASSLPESKDRGMYVGSLPFQLVPTDSEWGLSEVRVPLPSSRGPRQSPFRPGVPPSLAPLVHQETLPDCSVLDATCHSPSPEGPQPLPPFPRSRALAQAAQKGNRFRAKAQDEDSGSSWGLLGAPSTRHP